MIEALTCLHPASFEPDANADLLRGLRQRIAQLDRIVGHLGQRQLLQHAVRLPRLVLVLDRRPEQQPSSIILYQ